MTNHPYISPLSGVAVPRIIYGTAWKKNQTATLVREALQQGFRGIDTACQPKHYDEVGVGVGIAAYLNAELQRSDLYLQTKFTTVSGQDPARIPYDPAASLGEQVKQSVQVSLRNLQTHYVDCLVLHSPLANAEQLTEVWKAMEAIVDGGGARQLGISNCYNTDYLEMLHRSFRIKPAVLQNRFYADTHYDPEIRAFCKQQGIIYQSFWTLTANPHILSHLKVAALASKYERTPAQIFFRYLTQSAIVPLTGTTAIKHMQEDLAIFNFELAAPEIISLDSLL